MSARSTKPVSPGMRFFFGRIFPLIFVIVGALVLYAGYRNLRRAKASTAWPTAQGVVQRSSVEYHRGSKGGGTYHAEIMYDFTVDKTTFSGGDVAFGDYGSSNPSHARRIVNKYPQGKSVTVYYMPENPDVCVLEPGLKGQAWVVPVVGFIFFAAGNLMVIFLPRTMRKKETDTDETQADET